MARIRTIKPGFWRHEDLSELAEATHLLAAALLNYADDEGYFNANERLIKSECSPLREPSVSIQCSLTELSNVGFIRLGMGSDGKRYGHIVKFLDHQRVNRSVDSKIKTLCIVWDGSLSPHTQLTEPSLPEGNGREGKWKGNEGVAGATDETPMGFVGRVVRLTRADYDDWRKTYCNVPDFDAELRTADNYYSETPPKNGKWFFAVSNWLKKAHEQNKPKPKFGL